MTNINKSYFDKARAEFEEVFPLPSKCEWIEKNNAYGWWSEKNSADCWAVSGYTKHPHDELWQVWLTAKEKYESKISGYGCHCNLGPNQSPDGCVIDEGRINDCVYAKILSKKGKVRDDCVYWQPIRDPSTQGE